LRIATRTGAIEPSAWSMTMPGPTNRRSSGVRPPIAEFALNPVLAPSKLSPATSWLGRSKIVPR
jgi:hypothetical protein